VRQIDCLSVYSLGWIDEVESRIKMILVGFKMYLFPVIRTQISPPVLIHA